MTKSETSDANEPVLIPCPFCPDGGKPYFTKSVNGTNMAYVGCSQCGVQLKAQVQFLTSRDDWQLSKDIVAIWNSRVSPDSVAPAVDDEAFIQLLTERHQWYAEEIFSPWTVKEAQTVNAEFPGAVDRISADSARGTIDRIIEDIRTGRLRAVPASPTAPLCILCGHEALFSDGGTTTCKKPVRAEVAKHKPTAETHASDFIACGCLCSFSRAAPPAVPAVNNLQRRLYEECITANWDPEHENTFAEEIAHLHEELSEAFKAWRRYKDCAVREVNGKLEGVPIEFADALIGMFYNAELHGFDLLAAVERKHQFNLSRNYVAEGRQLHEPSAASPAAPQEPILNRINKFRDLLPNWDSYGGRAITPEAIDIALRIAPLLPGWQPVPRSDGGIQFERGDDEICIDVASAPQGLRHSSIPCNEFLCLPEVNPHHYVTVADAPQEEAHPDLAPLPEQER